jgi:enoyl-CoA hydratase/carnithine racemase
VNRFHPEESFLSTESVTDILSHREGGVLTLTFNRLDKKNAITTAMYTALAVALAATRLESSGIEGQQR